MKIDQVSFYYYSVVIDKSIVTDKQMENLCNEIDKNPIGNEPLAFEISYRSEILGIWFCIRYGKVMPYAPKVLNVKDLEIKSNQRSRDEAELRNQIFMFYQFATKNLLISVNRGFKTVTNILNNYLKKDVVITRQYKTEEEFVEAINSLDKVAFSGDRDLFTYKDSIFSQNLHLLGIEQCGKYKISCEVQEKMTDKIKDSIRKIKSKPLPSKRIELWGRDEKGFEKYFNTDYFRDNITLNCNKDSNSLFVEDDVRQKLILELGALN